MMFLCHSATLYSMSYIQLSNFVLLTFFFLNISKLPVVERGEILAHILSLDIDNNNWIYIKHHSDTQSVKASLHVMEKIKMSSFNNQQGRISWLQD